MSIGHLGNYIFSKKRSVIVLQEYEVGRSPSGVQEISRNRLAPLTEIQVKRDIYQC